MADTTDLGSAQTHGDQFDGNWFCDTLDLDTRVVLFGPFDALRTAVIHHVLEGHLGCGGGGGDRCVWCRWKEGGVGQPPEMEVS